MRILIVDDDATRHAIFERQYAGHDLAHVYSVDWAFDALDHVLFDLVQLDHDLQDFSARDENGMRFERTGQHVAGHIVQMPAERRPEHVIVHSWNMIGAKEISKVLAGHVKKITIKPFGR